MEDEQVQNTKSQAVLLQWDFVRLFIRDCILLLYGIISYADWGRETLMTAALGLGNIF